MLGFFLRTPFRILNSSRLKASFTFGNILFYQNFCKHYFIYSKKIKACHQHWQRKLLFTNFPKNAFFFLPLGLLYLTGWKLWRGFFWGKNLIDMHIWVNKRQGTSIMLIRDFPKATKLKRNCQETPFLTKGLFKYFFLSFRIHDSKH